MKLFIIIVLILIILISCGPGSLDPKFKYEELIDSKNTKIYLKSKSWGLTYDHQLSIITTNPAKKWLPDSLNDYIFHGLEPFIYEFRRDTLFIYSRNFCQQPNGFHSGIPIVQKSPDEYLEMIYKINHDSIAKLKVF